MYIFTRLAYKTSLHAIKYFIYSRCIPPHTHACIIKTFTERVREYYIKLFVILDDRKGLIFEWRSSRYGVQVDTYTFNGPLFYDDRRTGSNDFQIYQFYYVSGDSTKSYEFSRTFYRTDTFRRRVRYAGTSLGSGERGHHPKSRTSSIPCGLKKSLYPYFRTLYNTFKIQSVSETEITQCPLSTRTHIPSEGGQVDGCYIFYSIKGRKKSSRYVTEI